MNFSIILPTRNRIELFEEFMESIRKNTKHKHLVEVLVVGQEDDIITCLKLPKWKEEYQDLNFRYWILPWTEKYAPVYRKFLCERAIGKFIVSSEDEHEFMTKDWDEILLDKFEEFLEDKPDRVLYGRVKDNNRADGYSCVPIISWEALKQLGFEIYDMRFYGWMADQNLYALFSGMKNQRICQAPEVYIKHKSYHHKARGKDETNELVAEINNGRCPGLLDDDITDARRKKLDSFINGSKIKGRV